MYKTQNVILLLMRLIPI